MVVRQSSIRRFLTALSLCVGLSAAPVSVLAQGFNYSEEALQHLRGYYAVIDDSHKRDIVLLEGPDGRLYFPIGELGEHIDAGQALPLAQEIYGCAPCIPLAEVAEVEFDEAANRANIRIRDSYRKAQLFAVGRRSEHDLPLSYGGGLATSFNFLGRYDEETDEENYAADVDVGISLGRAGNLYNSHIFFDDGEDRRGQSFYEKFFDRAMVNVQAGDVITHSDAFGGSIQVGGFRVRRAYETRPDYDYRPVFKYFTEARLPGTLELLVDGQQLKKEEYDRGRLNFSSDVYGRGDELTLVLTDVMGNRTVIRESLFDVSENLAPGEVDFDVSYGAIREDENEYRGDYGSAFTRVGITNHWTQSFSFQGNSEFEQGSSAVILSAGNHLLNVEGAWSHEQVQDIEGHATIVNYAYDWQGELTWGRFGVEWFDTEQFSQFRGGTLSGDGITLSLSGGRGPFYYGISGFQVGDLEGGSLNLGFSRPGWYVEFGGEYLETDDYFAALTVGFRPAGRNKPRLRVGHGWERNNNSVAVDVSGSAAIGNSTLGYQVAAAQDYDRTDTVDSRAGLSLRSNVVDVRGNYEDVNSLARSSGRIKTGFVINRHDAFITSREVTQGYATVLTDREDVLLKGGGYQRYTGGGGEVSLPVPSFYQTRLTIERDSLRENDVLTKRNASLRVAKGNYGVVKMTVTQAPVIIHILNNGVNDIFINGRAFVHNDFGAYINQYNAGGENELEVAGESFTIELPMVKDELPVYEFDRESKKLARVNELFREAK